jgi:methionyl aminopeptidase
MIYIKTKKDIELIKEACRIWKIARSRMYEITKAGMSLNELNDECAKVIKENGGECAFYNYQGFPKEICISVNDEILHGIASDYKLKKNDLVTFDIGVSYKNRICDSAFSINLNEENLEAKKICEVTKLALDTSIKQVKIGNYVGDISNAIECVARENGYEVIKEYTGHGCGIKLHEDPLIYCYGNKHSGAKLVENMIICIEPMLLTGSDKVLVDKTNN